MFLHTTSGLPYFVSFLKLTDCIGGTFERNNSFLENSLQRQFYDEKHIYVPEVTEDRKFYKIS